MHALLPIVLQRYHLSLVAANVNCHSGVIALEWYVLVAKGHCLVIDCKLTLGWLLIVCLVLMLGRDFAPARSHALGLGTCSIG